MVLGGSAAAPVPSAFGASIPSNSLIVYRVGDGSAPLTDAAAPVFIDVFDFEGVHRDTIPVPSTGPNAMTATGNDPTEGIMSQRLAAGSFIRSFYFTGYRKDAGEANPSLDEGSATNRVLGSIRFSGVVDTSTALVDAPAGAIRSAYSRDGSEYWVGTAGGLRYVGAPGGATTTVEINSRDTRQVFLDSNSTDTGAAIYASSGSPESGKFFDYGDPPTGSSPGTPLVSLTADDEFHGFQLFNGSPAIDGPDMLFVLNTSEGRLRKFAYDGASWVSRGSVATAAANIAGIVTLGGTVIDLYLTSDSEIQKLTTNGMPELELTEGFPGLEVTGELTTIATASPNTAFRGIGAVLTVGVPEPAGALVAIVACSSFLAIRRQTVAKPTRK